ncbi:alkaline phosphatase D family protein [Roseococcus sp. YIM B11640]|uniref:alkaline phosphatase D family protein n=1 Tax=Roseococcus sp. YIM B11640 TaxID=3133973 RepID=UPI003C7CB13F
MDSATRHVLALSRRGLLGGATGLAALATLQPSCAQERAAGDPFTLGVASGDPWPDGVVLWTRLATDPLAEGGGMGGTTVDVAWEVAEDERMARVIQRGTAQARPELGHSVHVELTGLAPGRTYFYRFRTAGHASRTGRTRTAPAPGTAADIRFLNAGCQNYEHGHFTAWRHAAAEEEIDFVFHYGDYIYEYAGRPIGGRGWGTVIRSHHGGETLRLEDYRARYAQYRLDADLAAAHAAHPFVCTYDDHEIENNWVSLISQRDGGRRFPVATPPEVFALRAAAALQAWYENMPVRVASLPRGNQITAYRRLRFGRNLELHALDTRRFRDDQPCGDGTVEPCEAVANPAAQVLGATQEAWLRDGMGRSQARWQVLGQQIFVAPREYAEGKRSMDSWDGYPAARARLLGMLQGKDVVVLTGDVHRAWANDLALTPGAAPVAVEFVGTSITSEGDGSEAQPIAAELMSRNPHLRFHSNRRGYTLHVARPDRLDAIYRCVTQVSQGGAPREDRGHFMTLAGRPGVVAA